MGLLRTLGVLICSLSLCLACGDDSDSDSGSSSASSGGDSCEQLCTDTGTYLAMCTGEDDIVGDECVANCESMSAAERQAQRDCLALACDAYFMQCIMVEGTIEVTESNTEETAIGAPDEVTTPDDDPGPAGTPPSP